jgi:hypothetical protein
MLLRSSSSLLVREAYLMELQGPHGSAVSIPGFPKTCLPPGRPEPQDLRPASAGGGDRGAAQALPSANPAANSIRPEFNAPTLELDRQRGSRQTLLSPFAGRRW